jgi:hypothetical protein
MSGRLGALLALSSIALVSCSSSSGGEGPGAVEAGSIADTGAPDNTAQATVSQVVGASGGSVATTGLTLTIPQGALADSTTITVQNEGAVPQGYVGLSSLFQFGPDGTVFAQPVTVSFPISGGTNPAVFWSNAQGGFDEVPTTATSTAATAQVTHFSQGFCGESQHGSDASAGSSGGSASSSSGAAGSSSGGLSTGSSGGSSSGSSSSGGSGGSSSSSSSGGSSSGGSSSGGSSSGSSGGIADSGIADSGIADVSAPQDAVAAPAIEATVDGTPTSFAYNVTVTAEQAWWLISGDDAPSGAHWTLSILTPVDANTLGCQNSMYPSINYRHYSSSDAAADQVFTSESSTGASCTIDELTTAMTAGSTAQGTFSAVLVLQGDAAAASHTFSGGSYDAVVP